MASRPVGTAYPSPVTIEVPVMVAITLIQYWSACLQACQRLVGELLRVLLQHDVRRSPARWLEIVRSCQIVVRRLLVTKSRPVFDLGRWSAWVHRVCSVCAHRLLLPSVPILWRWV